MSFNISNYGGKISAKHTCIHDSNVGYFADFSIDGNVDGWTYYDGIHTYGCWNNFLFGTLYDSYALIGRPNVFRPIPAETFIYIKLTMNLNVKARAEGQVVPSTGRVMWTTLSDSVWNSTKQFDFNIICDNEWHVYMLNMGEAQWWQGDINNLRIYPILADGRDDDEFFIKTIEILSTNDYLCNNVSCSYYTQYQHSCKGVGLRASCLSKADELVVEGGTIFEHSETKLYNIEKDVNDELLININGYGFENIKLDVVTNVTINQITRIFENAISKIDIGGYAEVEVTFNDTNQIIIYSGTYTNDSTVEIGFNSTSVYFNFFDSEGNTISTITTGTTPATGFVPLSSFKLQSFQLNGLLDVGNSSYVYFNPDNYSIEGGRSDWLESGIGNPSKDIRGTDSDLSNLLNRTYNTVNNAGKTIIDFNHPFNASGRISKICAAVTLDNTEDLSNYGRSNRDTDRQIDQLSNAKIMFFRPTKDGNFKVLPFEIDILDRDYDSGKIYAANHEFVEIDCDVFVNKGDYIGIYNANIYVGKALAGTEVDALYYQVDGKAYGTITVNQPSGYGQAGLLVYARSSQRQNKLFLTLDLGKRVNVKNINVYGDVYAEKLEYNIARCLDVNWEVDMLGGDFTTSYVVTYTPVRIDYYFNHPNMYYGKECLNDGIKTVQDGVAGDGFAVEIGSAYTGYSSALHKKDGGRSMIVYNPKYFQTNGDCEWLAVYFHIPGLSCPCEPKSMRDFEHDPMAFTLKFPYEKEKLLHKSKIFFKERFNFRSFALSFYKGDFYTGGTSDDQRFDLIPNRTDGYDTPWTKIILDGNSYTPENIESWKVLDLYLAKNPCIGHLDFGSSGIHEFSISNKGEYDGVVEYDPLGGLVYYETGSVLNNTQLIQATSVDWTTISHEWSDFKAKGFRFYCDYHESTKICEFEVYCTVENFVPSLVGMIGVAYYSYIDDIRWVGDVSKLDDFKGISAFVGDTPRYIDIEIVPITQIMLKSIDIDISSEDVYMGEKGCNNSILIDEAKTNSINNTNIVEFKNTYNRPYDLYIDIDRGSISDKGLVFYSKLNNPESITNPLVGADAYYKKHSDYKLLNYESNVAINCPVYALKNLIEGAKAWYTHDNINWNYYGVLADTTTINISNISNLTYTRFYLPIIKRSKWWKIGFFDTRISFKIREVRVFYQGTEISGVKFYHHRGQSDINTASTDVAIHLDNDNYISFYTLNGTDGTGGYLGIELPGVGLIDRVDIYHDTVLIYEKSNEKAGIDLCTGLYICGAGSTYQTDTIKDSSYFKHEVQIVGSGIYCDSSDIFISKGVTHLLPTVSISADSYQYNYPANAIDFSLSTFWRSYNSSSYPHWWKCDFGEGTTHTINKLYIKLYYSSSYAPKSFLFQGSNNNSSWYTVYSGQMAETGNVQTFSFTNITAYRYYRIYWTDSWSGIEIAVYEIGFAEYQAVGSDSDLVLKSPIRFNGVAGEKIIAKYDNNPLCNYVDESFTFDIKRFTIEFFIKFNSLPTSGNYVVLAKSWAGDPRSVVNSSSSWAFTLENISGAYKLRFYFNSAGIKYLIMDTEWLLLGIGVWHHVAICRGPESNIDSENDYYWYAYYSRNVPCYYTASLMLNGAKVYLYAAYQSTAGWAKAIYTSKQDVEIGENLDGWIDSFRISSSYTPGGGRLTPITLGVTGIKDPPTYKFKPYYCISIYVSDDNLNYGKLTDLDVLFTTDYSYYNSGNFWSNGTNTVFYIDFGQRHDIELIRSFPVDTAYQISTSTAISVLQYSNRETDDCKLSFSITDDQDNRIRNMSFGVDDNAIPEDWFITNIGNSNSFTKEAKFYQFADGVNSITAKTSANTKFYLSNNFDIQIDFELSAVSNNNEWYTALEFKDANNSNNIISIRRAFLSGSSQYAVYIQDNNSTATKTTYFYTNDTKGTLRLYRDKNSFIVYIKRQDQSDFQTVYSCRFVNTTVSWIMSAHLITCSQASTYPSVKVYWNNFKVNYGSFFYPSSYNDARWIRIILYNDSTTKTLKRIGVYPNVSSQYSVDRKFNTCWSYLGESVTNYTTNENIAFGATVSGSSYVGFMLLDHITDGIIGTDLNSCWGSDSDSIQWVILCLSEVQSIFRIKLYHGYDGMDSKNIINDYSISVSTDNINYSTIFTITNNLSFIRTHDLSSPVNAKFIKIDITKYTASINRFVWTSETEGHQYWKGAVLREVEVYKYYGFSILNSETTPIIAVDLRQNYFIAGHSLLGIDVEDTWTDWDNSDSNFAYSNSNLSDPSKVSFGEWGMSPDYERWVVIKRNTATKYPNATERHPAHEPPYPANESAIPDYLKHVIINASSDELGTKPNPTEYPWMWRSSLSELSSDYNLVKFTTNRSLRIDYPPSSGIEHVYNIEGDHFGFDTAASWRDGCGFYLYIDDIHNLDLTYGYFYLGGYDYTTAQNSIIYKWYLPSISGSLQSGWNNLNLTFMYADQIEYTQPSDANMSDVRRLYSIKLNKIGMTFRGKGNKLQMNLDGFHVERNHFEHLSMFDYGLYLHKHDMLKLGAGGIDFHSGTIEFFIRPDWNFDGRDVFNDFKYRSLFHFSNTSNDVFGATISSNGVEIYFGSLISNFNVFVISSLDISVIDTIFHMAFVFSNDGVGIASDKSTIRFYINNILVAKTYETWEIRDAKHFYLVVGGQSLAFQKMGGGVTETSSVDGVISNLKIYNYCKTDFKDSLNNIDILMVDGGNNGVTQPYKLIEISDDNVTFYKVGSSYLPMLFEDVGPNETIPIYVKTNIPKNLTGKEKRTADIVGSWDVGV